ncbi:MAG: OmpA family protein [Magnetococcales bacterium]|nr:OmpA family protein [Magnetococcales bacterium]
MPRFIPIIRRKTETTENPFWISYADLMTALVILFLVIMSISIVAISSRPIVEKKERDTEINAIFDQLEKMATAKNLGLNINRINHTITFGKNAQFSIDSYQLSPEAQAKLRAFVPIMLKVKHSAEGKRWLKRVHIEGYTDETGSYLYNVHLSLKRAEAVICALFSGNLPKSLESQLQQLLIIDGASITGIKDSWEESRRVDVRLEFRQPGDSSQPTAVPKMPLGFCVIDQHDETTTEAEASEPAVIEQVKDKEPEQPETEKVKQKIKLKKSEQ